MYRARRAGDGLEAALTATAAPDLLRGRLLGGRALTAVEKIAFARAQTTQVQTDTGREDDHQGGEVEEQKNRRLKFCFMFLSLTTFFPISAFFDQFDSYDRFGLDIVKGIWQKRMEEKADAIKTSTTNVIMCFQSSTWAQNERRAGIGSTIPDKNAKMLLIEVTMTDIPKIDILIYSTSNVVVICSRTTDKLKYIPVCLRSTPISLRCTVFTISS